MADNMELACSRNVKRKVADNVSNDVHSGNELSELGIPPEGGYTGDTSGLVHPFDVLAPWTCESCPDPWSQFKAIGPEFMGNVILSSDEIRWGDIYTHASFVHEIPIYTWPTRCRSCDTRYKKHKRTTNALVRIFRHPVRQEKVDGIWVFTRDETYREIKLITLTVPNTIFRLSSEPPAEQCGGGVQSVLGRSLCEWTQMPGFVTEIMQQQLKEPFRRLRKRKFWKEHVVYGRWFAEVTWTVHFQDGSKSEPTQWMPGEKELEGATSVEVHPHLHVIAVAKGPKHGFTKERLTEWWTPGSTHIQATGSWWSCKQYLTKYLNKQQFEGRNQGTFGKTL